MEQKAQLKRAKELLQEMYDWTSYKNTSWAQKTKVLLDEMNEKFRKCAEKDCKRRVEKPYVFCSIECACYAGYFSVTKGWIKDPKELK